MSTTTEVKRQVKHQFRSMRRYIRANPEKGVVTSFMGGVVFGILLTKIAGKL
ncbi:MAG TPA: hypothetical protein VKA34_07635 [Balneolales bacterium]|nr:hypothetical protein [Balneolales bacterium]